MMGEWVSRFSGLSGIDQLYIGLWLGTALLLGMAVAFGAATLHLRLRNDRKARRWQRLETTWEPVILDVLSGGSPPTALQALVSDADRLYFLSFLLRYARRLKGEERDLVHELARPHLDTLIPRVTHGNAERRARAVGTLAEMGMPAYAAAIAPALDDESPLVAMIAARSLFVPDLADFFPQVLARLHRFELWSRGFLAGMLAGGGAAAAAPLRQILADSGRGTFLRVVAADALTRLHDLESSEVAARALEREEDPEVVAASIRLLGKLGTGEHLPEVRSRLGSPHEAIRGAAAKALGALGGPEDIGPLAVAVEDASTWVALHAARSLKRLGGTGALGTIAEGERHGASVALQVLGE